MSKYAIQIEGLWKQYRLGERQPYVALRDILSNPLSVFSPKPKEEFWALKDINLKVKEGEVLGVIGKNGSGKSTLLKILTRITPPTKGQIKLHGRVASLLEVGTGFNPELTGRENIFLNGSILGMTRSEIKRKFDEIVDFSGVEKFIDTPVKRYSSGMYVRLAFAVAAHLESEILLVDEVLAVGDMEFQKKCLGKMKDVTKNQGRTILFVSHNMHAIYQLCNESLFIDLGRIIDTGTTDLIINQYLNFNIVKSEAGISSKYLRDIKLINNKNTLTNTIDYNQNAQIKFILDTKNKIVEEACFTIVLFNHNKQPVATLTNLIDQGFKFKQSNHNSCIVSCEISNIILKPGKYFINIAVDALLDGDRIHDRIPDVLEFEVLSSKYSKRIDLINTLKGEILIPQKWKIN